MALKHRFTSAVLDGVLVGVVKPSNWNDGHDLAGQARGDLVVINSVPEMDRLAVVAAGSVLVSGTDPAWSTSPKVSGYLRVGSASVPTNTTAGDITAVRGHFGTDAVFGSGETLVNINGVFKTAFNSQARPASDNSFGGLAVTWNYTNGGGGGGENDFWNLYDASPASIGGFSFIQKTGASTSLLLAAISPLGQLSLPAGVTGAAPTPQITLGSYFDNSGNPSVSHIDLYGGAFGLGISAGTLNIISAANSNIAMYTGPTLATPTLYLLGGGGANHYLGNDMWVFSSGIGAGSTGRSLLFADSTPTVIAAVESFDFDATHYGLRFDGWNGSSLVAAGVVNSLWTGLLTSLNVGSLSSPTNTSAGDIQSSRLFNVGTASIGSSGLTVPIAGYLLKVAQAGTNSWIQVGEDTANTYARIGFYGRYVGGAGTGQYMFEAINSSMYWYDITNAHHIINYAAGAVGGSVLTLYPGYIISGNNAPTAAGFTASGATGSYVFNIKGVGTGARDYGFYVNTSGHMVVDDQTAPATRWSFENTGVFDSVQAFRCRAGQGGATSNTFSIYWTGSTVVIYIDSSAQITLTPPSDVRLKRDITPMPWGGIEVLSRLNPVAYNWINEKDPQERRYGLLAQEVQEVLPDLVKLIPIQNDFTDDGIMRLDYEQLHAFEIKAIQELTERLQKLESELADLRRN